MSLHQSIKTIVNALCTSDTFINQVSETLFNIISIKCLKENVRKLEESLENHYGALNKKNMNTTPKPTNLWC